MTALSNLVALNDYQGNKVGMIDFNQVVFADKPAFIESDNDCTQVWLSDAFFDCLPIIIEWIFVKEIDGVMPENYNFDAEHVKAITFNHDSI